MKSVFTAHLRDGRQLDFELDPRLGLNPRSKRAVRRIFTLAESSGQVDYVTMAEWTEREGAPDLPTDIYKWTRDDLER